MNDSHLRRRPPIWLASAAVASAWASLYAIGIWIYLFFVLPVHEDVRMTYVAAQAGLRYGWSTIYDQAILLSLSSSFPPGQRKIDSLYTYLHPPLFAWVFAPLTALPEPAAYVVWTLVSLAAFIFAWRIAAPYSGLAKVTLLLLAIGLWPILLAFYYGQPTTLVLGLVAGSWWLCRRDRFLAAGIALALATFLKPQMVLLIIPALAVSGRYRVVIGWGAGCVVLGVATVVALGPAGLESWWQALKNGQVYSHHTANTLIHFFGFGPMTVLLWTIQGAAALIVARRQRHQTEMVYAAALLGTATIAFHFHELDYSILVLAAWLFLRTSPPLWQRVWLIVGVATLEVMAFGSQAVRPAWDLATHAPPLIWDATWLAILVVAALKEKDFIESPRHRFDAIGTIRPALASKEASSRPNGGAG
jgi:hypothetical protein